MPVHLSPISRRHFIRSSIIAGVSVSVFRDVRAASEKGDTHWALLSDTHIDANPERIASEVNMTAHLKQAVAEVLALENKPAGVFVNGDIAYAVGLPADYANYSSLVQPFPAADIPLHMTLGNHDRRENFRAALTKDNDKASPIAGRHVSIIETSLANWVLLDSLDKDNSVPGLLGKEQLAWLAVVLDARKDKPAIVMVHHFPETLAPGNTNGKYNGLIDTAELFEVLLPRKHVKALVFGHSHVWDLKQRDGLHLVNLPAVAYVFIKENREPSAWVDCHLAAEGMTLELRSLNPAHPAHGKKTELTWRT